LTGPAAKSAGRCARIDNALTDRAIQQKCVGGSRLAERTLSLPLVSGGRFNFRLGLRFLLLGQSRLACLTSARLTSVGIAIQAELPKAASAWTSTGLTLGWT
jgi:hypothetical protein